MRKASLSLKGHCKRETRISKLMWITIHITITRESECAVIGDFQMDQHHLMLKVH